MVVSRLHGVLGVVTAGLLVVAGGGIASGSTPAGDVRLSNDAPSTAGYVSADDLAGLPHYTDATLDECSRSRGRQNEPALAIDPRDNRVMVGSSNDYCGVYNDGVDANGAPIASGPIWLGYYRSETSGTTFTSSLVPGYPGDRSTLGALAHVRTANSGDPVAAWDAEGRLFMGSESSGDPQGSTKTFGDVWVGHYVNPDGPTGSTLNDGKRFAGSVDVALGSAAPNLLGKFHDKTAIEVDRTSSACHDTVYFSWARFTGGKNSAIYVSTSTDHGASFSTPMKVSASVRGVQFPDISVTSDGHAHITFVADNGGKGQQSVIVVDSADCGRTFSAPRTLVNFDAMGLVDKDASGGDARDCGDATGACQSGYTFFRADSGPRSTADQADPTNTVHVVYEAIVPGSQVPTGTTFGWTGTSGEGGQSAIYYLRDATTTGAVSTPTPVDLEPVGQQLFPDVAVDGGTVHVLWWDSRNDTMNDASSFRQRPVGNDASGNVGDALDTYGATRPAAASGSWTGAVRISDRTTNPNFEQFSGRTVPFAGDYLWIDSKGGLTFGVWTDWRDTVGGTDLREATADETGADVLQCRTTLANGSISGDTCPRAGGLDQNIYGDQAP